MFMVRSWIMGYKNDDRNNWKNNCIMRWNRDAYTEVCLRMFTENKQKKKKRIREGQREGGKEEGNDLNV